MSKRGILWRVLGDDPERWQSAEAWSVVADLCEREGADELALWTRLALATERAGISLLWTLQQQWMPRVHAVPSSTFLDTDGVIIRLWGLQYGGVGVITCCYKRGEAPGSFLTE